MNYYILTLCLTIYTMTLPMFQLADKESLQNRFKNNEKYYNFITENKIDDQLASKVMMPVSVQFIVDTLALKHNVIKPESDELSRRDMELITEKILHDAVLVPFANNKKSAKL